MKKEKTRKDKKRQEKTTKENKRKTMINIT